ncbi:uncharacterized protein LOC111379878, partial [Olea europaea var. sylvestris]|uniref:uncharacterized protein LOC111379878 n=1 Tax=Olea europaea var. sylvestris TaxID=158386 RepID=UPI000C1D3C13
DGNLKENVSDEAKKKEKPKKVKKPKVTVAEAAAKIDAADLAAFLSNVLVSYEGQQEIQLMRFADYFGRAFSAVSASQFPWLKLFRESTVEKIADVPVSYISETVYKTSVDWINHCSYDALGSFVLWSLDGILADLTTQQLGSKVSKKGGQPTSSKSQVHDLYKQDKIYIDNIEVSVAALRKLSKECKEIPLELSSLEALRQTIKIFRQKNENALAGGLDVARQALFKDADKYCKVILDKISRGHSCARTMAFAFVVLAVGVAVISPKLDEWDWDKFTALFNAH